MGMLTAMNAGVSGLNVHGKALSSVADNIANVSTHGYKSTRPAFGDVMVQSLTVGGNVVDQVGSGSRILEVQNIMNQGSFESTDVPTDLAINGKGFFQVSETDTATGASRGTYYTRSGMFVLDREGYLVSPLGYRLQGYNVDQDGNLEQLAEDIRILTQQADAIPTENVDISINLDAEDEDEHHASQPVVPTDQDTWNFMTTTRVYDSLGIGHDVSLFYQRLERGTYDGTSPAGTINTYKVSAFEKEGDVWTQDNISGASIYYLHFDSDGQLLGSSTGRAGYGDRYLTSGTFANDLNTLISNRVGESFTYEGESGPQTFITTLDVDLGATWDNTGDYIQIGNATYTYDDYGNVTDLVAAINTAARDTGIWAGWVSASTPGQFTLYGDGNSALGFSTSTSVSATVSGTSLSTLNTAVNNGAHASGVIALNDNTAPFTVPTNVDLAIGGTTISFPAGTTIGNVATSISNTLNALGGTWEVQTIGNSIFFRSTGQTTSDTFNYDVVSTDHNSIRGMRNDAATGGMDDSTLTEVAAGMSTGTSHGWEIYHRQTGASAELTLGSITLGANLAGISFTPWDQITYASDEQTVTDPETESQGERTITFNWLTDYGSTEPQDIQFDFSPTESAASTFSAGASETFYLYQDGSPRGSLQSLDIARDGTISGQFSNGTLRTLGAVVIVNFANAAALSREGENLWTQTIESGDPVVNLPGQGGFGTIESGALEQSNVDLANEFVKMINYQRAFQANSKTISTTDQMLAELINLKR